MTNERSEFFHDCVIKKGGMGYQIGTDYTLILGVFVSQDDVPRGGGSIMEYESINNKGRGVREG